MIKCSDLDKNIIFEFSNKLLSYASSKPYIIEEFIDCILVKDKVELIFNSFMNNISVLEDLYIATLGTHMDLEGELFIKLVRNNVEFLGRYIINLIDYRDFDHNYYDIDKIWETENHSELIYFAVETLAKYVKEKGLSMNGDYFKHVFRNTDKTTNLAKERKIEWVKGYIDRNSKEIEKMIMIFEVIVEVLDTDKKELILNLLKNNSDIDIFKEIPLFHWAMSWSGSEVPLIEEQISFLLELLESLNGLKYIEHKAYLKEEIMHKEKYKQNVLIDEYLRDCDLA